MKKSFFRSYEFRLVAFFFLTWGFVFLSRSSLGYLLPTMVEDFNLNNSLIGQANMWQTIGFAISAPLIGALSDKTGYRKRILVIAVLATGIFTMLSALAPTFWVLVVIRFLVGASLGPIFPLIVAIMADASGSKGIGRNVGIINAGVSIIANMLGPTLVTQLVTFTNWQMTFLFIGIPSLLLALILWKFTKEVNPKDTVTSEPEQSGSSYKDVLKYRNVKIGILLSVFCMSSLWILYSFGPLYLTEIGLLSTSRMGFSMSAMGVVGIIWVILIPMISDYIGRKPTVIFFSALAILAPLGLFLFPQTWVGIAALIGVGGVIGSLPPIFMNIIPTESLPANLSATASSLIMGLGELVGALVIGLSGTLADTFGLKVVMISGAIAPLLMVFIAFGLIESNARKKKQAT